MTDTKLTKAKLLSEMDARLQQLNLLKAALQAEHSLKKDTLAGYKQQFDALFAVPKPKKK